MSTQDNNLKKNSAPEEQSGAKNTQQVPLDLPFPDIDFDALSAPINDPEYEERKRKYKEEQQKEENKESQVPADDCFEYNLFYMGLSLVLLVIVGLGITTIPSSDANFFFHPMCLIVLCVLFHWQYTIS